MGSSEDEQNFPTCIHVYTFSLSFNNNKNTQKLLSSYQEVKRDTNDIFDYNGFARTFAAADFCWVLYLTETTPVNFITCILLPFISWLRCDPISFNIHNTVYIIHIMSSITSLAPDIYHIVMWLKYYINGTQTCQYLR